MKRCISIGQSTMEFLTKKYGITPRSIFYALTFKTINRRGRNIRYDAIRRGGLYLEEGFNPNCRIETGDGVITLTFATGLRLTLSQTSGISAELWGIEIKRIGSADAADTIAVISKAISSSKKRMAERDIFGVVTEEPVL